MRCKKKDCKYRVPFAYNHTICDYIGIRGQSRGCDPGNRDKYEKKKGNEKKSSWRPVLLTETEEAAKDYIERTSEYEQEKRKARH